MTERPDSRRASGLAIATILVVSLTGACAGNGALRAGQQAENRSDFDRAVVEYTAAVRRDPDDRGARLALERVRLRASLEHYLHGRRLAASEQYQQAAIELQLAAELNPTDAAAASELKEVQRKLRMKIAVTRDGKTQLETLIERSRDFAPPGLDLPIGTKLPESMTFPNASSRMVFMAVARLADINVTFDPAFRDERIGADLRNMTLAAALSSLTATTRTFYRVTAPRTITIVPDTPAKRREYEEQVIKTFYVSNAELKEVMDLLRIVVDVRQISQATGINAVSIKDTPERIAAASQLIAMIDKARPEVVINVGLMEVDRTRLKDTGLQIASPGSDGISGSIDANREGMTLHDLTRLTTSDVFVTGLPALYYRLIKTDTATRILANPQLRASEGTAAQAQFGERVPIPITTFAPIATGGINQQPITSFIYENIGVNIDITPRTHHNDEVSLLVKVTLSNISGQLNNLPTFGNRQISTTIRLKDGETNMLAGLIRDEERTAGAGIPGLAAVPVIGRLFANNRKESLESDIILTLTPHIVRVLDVTETDLRPFRLGRDAGGTPTVELPSIGLPRDKEPPAAEPVAAPQQPTPAFPQPLQPTVPTQPLKGPLPGQVAPILPPTPPKKGGGGS